MGSKFDMQVRGIVDNIVFSKDDIWAYYLASTEGYEFLNADSKVAMLQRVNQTFINVARDRNTELDWHMVVTNTPVDIDHWEDQFLKATESWDRKPGFNKFFQSQLEHLQSGQYMSRKVYLGIKIGTRHAISAKGLFSDLESGWKQAAASLHDWFRSMGVDDYAISDKEVEGAKNVERNFYSIMSTSSLSCTRPEAEELGLVIKRALYPAMPTPYLDFPANGRWGHGDIIRETGADITRNRRWTEIAQPIEGRIVTGYRATLTFSKFPSFMSYPSGIPWVYLMQGISLPFDFYARFTVIPSKEMKKIIARKKSDVFDEGANAAEAGAQIPQDLQDYAQTATDVENYANRSGEPFLKGVYRIVVTAPDVDMLQTAVDVLKTTYSNMDIVLTWTAGDQQDLLLEYMPGDRIRESSFIQHSNIELIGASGFNIFNKIGDDDHYSPHQQQRDGGRS